MALRKKTQTSLLILISFLTQVDKIGQYEAIIYCHLGRYRRFIKAKLAIDWTKTRWQDLRKPLYSGLAARLYLAKISAPIPAQICSRKLPIGRDTTINSPVKEQFINDVRCASAALLQDSCNLSSA